MTEDTHWKPEKPVNHGCPSCWATGKQMRIKPILQSQPTRFTDDKGRDHNHYPDPVVILYACPNGHSWEQSEPRRCPFGDFPTKNKMDRKVLRKGLKVDRLISRERHLAQ